MPNPQDDAMLRIIGDVIQHAAYSQIIVMNAESLSQMVRAIGAWLCKAKHSKTTLSQSSMLIG